MEPNVGFQPQNDNPAKLQRYRLAFEAFLIALCGYLIGVGGLPPLFDAPGSSNEIRSSSTQDAATQVDGQGTEVAAPAAPNQPGAGVSVTIARPTWTTGYFQAALFKELLQELGYQVSEPSTNEHAPGDVYRLMAEGSVDVWASTWTPIHQPFIEETLEDGSAISSRITTVGDLMPAAGLEGILINKDVVADYGITSLQQVNDTPDLAELFDSDGDGVAEIYGCPDDFTCDNIIDEMIEFNGWDNLVQVKDDYSTMVNQSAEKVDAGTPVLQYTWSPSGYLTMLRPGDNVLWLNLGGQELVLDGSITSEFDFNDAEPAQLGAACTGEPCWLGWVPADIRVTANNEFLDANPAARALFEQVQLKVLDVALANVKYDSGETTDQDLARHAQTWITENRETVDGWLNAARAQA